MAQKRKPETLSIEQKVEILELLEKGQSRKIIAEKYGISRATVAYTYALRNETEEYLETKPVFINRFIKRLPLSRSSDLDRIVYQWCIRCMKHNIEMTGVQIQKKALELNEKINGYPGFKASGRWLQNFRDRNRTGFAHIRQDFPTPTKTAGDTFKVRFNIFLRNEGFILENVYSAGYAPIMWKAVPQETSVFRRAKWTVSQKMCEDHVTTLLCTNATGCHKLPVLIIGRIVETQSSYNLNTNAFSTIYTANTNAWINSTIFNLWFEECFLKSVKNKQEKNGRREKTLLLLDNSKSLPDLKDLNKKDEFVTVVSPPLDVTSCKQPMNCGIIASFKRKYRKELVQTLASLHLCNTEDEVIDIHKKLNMWDFCRIVHDAWANIDKQILVHAWDSLLNPRCTWNVEYSKIIRNDVLEITELLHALPGCERCNAVNVSNWLIFDNIHHMVMKICTDEVLRDFEDKTLDNANIGIVDDEAGPSRSKISKLS